MTEISKQPSAAPSPGSIPASLYPLLIVVALAFLTMSLCFVLPQRALDRAGPTTTGTIRYLSSKNGKVPSITYTYQVGNQTFTHQNAVNGDAFGNARAGDQLTVTYLPNRPQVSRPEASTDADAGYMMLLFSSIFGVLVLVSLGNDLWKRLTRNTN